MNQEKGLQINRTHFVISEKNNGIVSADSIAEKVDQLEFIKNEISKRSDELMRDWAKVISEEEKTTKEVVNEVVTKPITDLKKKRGPYKKRKNGAPVQRPHKRSGHYKTYKSGKKVWIDEVVVNYPEDTVVVLRQNPIQWVKSMFKTKKKKEEYA